MSSPGPDPAEVRPPVIDQTACVLCGACRQACAYDAIVILGGKVRLLPELCRGCGACVRVCTPGAIAGESRGFGEAVTLSLS